MALLNNSDEVLFISYGLDKMASDGLDEMAAQERVEPCVGSFQDFNIDRFSNPPVMACVIRINNSAGELIQYLSHPMDTTQDYIIWRSAYYGRLCIGRVFKCSPKDEERPFEWYLRHNLSIQQYATYFKMLNSNAGNTHLPGDAVFLPEVRGFVKCKNCAINSTQDRKQRQSKLIEGVYCLHQPKDGTNPEFDLLFIHGLRRSVGDGQPWLTTWSTRGRDKVECWPQVWLPKVFPKARVLALSYNSSMSERDSNPIALWESAINIINALLSSSVGFGERPYFLVGHSMGGLLVKEILLRAGIAAHRGENIIKHCKGLVFYGVPHLGATTANFVALINAVTFGVSRLAAEDLQLFGERCNQRNIDFEDYMDKLPAFNFVETRETLCAKLLYLWPVKLMVVPKEIAEYGAQGSHVAFIDADHHEVCQPSQTTDSNFALFKSFIHDKLVAANLPCTINPQEELG